MRFTSLFALLPAALITVGCADDGADDADEGTVASALEREQGGYDTVDEAPMFAAETAFSAAAVEGDAAVADELDADSAVVAMSIPHAKEVGLSRSV